MKTTMAKNKLARFRREDKKREIAAKRKAKQMREELFKKDSLE